MCHLPKRYEATVVVFLYKTVQASGTTDLFPTKMAFHDAVPVAKHLKQKKMW